MSASSRIQAGLQKATRREGVKAFVCAYVDAQGQPALYIHAESDNEDGLKNLAQCCEAFAQFIEQHSKKQ